MIQLKSIKALQISGYSRAAHRTGLEVKGLNILLDAGLDVQKAYEHIFITHQHLDHTIYLPQYTMNIDNNIKMNIISTQNILDNVKPYLASALRMSKNIDKNITNDEILNIANTNFVNLDIINNNIYEFKNGKDKWIVNLIKCFHGIDSIGFGFSIIKNKLKPEYIGLDNKEIVILKMDNIQLTDEVKENVFLFLGDTDKKILENQEIYKYKTIIMECTYIYDTEEEIKLAKINKHMHWTNIKDIIQKHNNIQFILIHFSMKYTKKEIEEFFKKENLMNVDLLI
jgi:ribonuclease Z